MLPPRRVEASSRFPPARIEWTTLHMRNGVQVVGDGKAVLLKVPSITSALVDYIGYGHYEFTVAEPDKFKVGMGVLITDKNAGGFYETTATIIGQKGRLFFIDRMLVHDYVPFNEGRVNTLFPLIDGYGARDFSVRGLVLDGNVEETRRLSGCRGGCVFLLNCHNVQLDGIEARHYLGDGISFQQCTDISVTNCYVHDLRGCGLHPGSGSVRYVFRRNRVIKNTNCGLFYCLRTTHSRCEENVIEENGAEGISVGERDTNHAILNNVIRNNGGPGINFRKFVHQGGDDAFIQDNRIEHNCQKEGEHEIVIPDGLHGIWIHRNTITPAKGKALSVGATATDIVFAENTVSGHPQTTTDVVGNTASVKFALPSGQLPVGPEAAPEDSARHLHI
ncbi:MAG: right-handed parallel beta-helix repeat-containing protein [Verrucomicrobiae bacterium]|nr:right-handed parallel beta-helix repeat-containing protein [Verrucomicrobiae bacterium]